MEHIVKHLTILILLVFLIFLGSLAVAHAGNEASTAKLKYQTDGNLCILSKSNKGYCATNGIDDVAPIILYKNPKAVLTDDGRFLLVDKGGKEIWSVLSEKSFISNSQNKLYQVYKQWGGSSAPWHDGGVWVIGGRSSQPVVAFKVSSNDNGKTLVGTMTYKGECPIGSRSGIFRR